MKNPLLLRFVFLFIIFFAILITIISMVVTSNKGIGSEHPNNEYLSDSRNAYENENSRFYLLGKKEYKCYGTCSCQEENDSERRRGVGSFTSRSGTKIVATGILSVSAILALRTAQKQFEHDCEEVLECENNDQSYILSEVDNCVTEENSEEEEDTHHSSDNNIKYQDECSLNDAMFGRQSHRDFNSEKDVSKEDLEDIITAGNKAPSAMNRQPLRYHVVDNPILLQEISDECLRIRGNKPLPRPMTSIFYNAPVVIFISWKGGGERYRGIDTGLAMQNMQLLSFQKGLGSCCIGNARYGDEYIAKRLGFEEGEKMMCALVVGYPSGVEVPVKERNPNVVDWSNSKY